MKATLVPGLEHTMTFKVEAHMTPGHIAVPVLSTPSMIQMIEGTCLMNAAQHLDDGETTVGTHVCVSHTGPARVGEDVSIKSRLKEINKRRLLFDVEVTAPSGTISTGTHERAVVTHERLAKT
jgi:fluoroacetyl-CoA thioesterase